MMMKKQEALWIATMPPLNMKQIFFCLGYAK